MAYPIWLTPAGNLGIVPEQEYYQLPLDAYDEAGGTLSYRLISGTLPPGIQVVTTGYLQGIPISTAGPDLNQTYSFTIRVTNTSDGNIADRTFSLTITNIAPPIIVPRNVNLGTYFDGSIINIQLVAVEAIKGAKTVWSLKSGNLPPGITLSTSGLLYGYLEPIPAQGLEGEPGWDDTPWDDLGWQFPLGSTEKYFNFTVEVFDGANYDVSTYKILVVPKSALEADATVITVDGNIYGNAALTVDQGDRHMPIITTTQSDIVPERQGGWFAFQIQAVDLDGDVLQYVIPSLDAGSFDEQTLVGNSISYVDSLVSGGNIASGITGLNGSTQLLVNGTNIQVPQNYYDSTLDKTYPLWYNATVTNYATLEVTGNSIVTASPGNFITQSFSGANATIASVGTTTGTVTYGGGLLEGTLTVYGINVITANVGAYITQPSTGANATVLANVNQAVTVSVVYNTGTFNIGSGNLLLNGVPLVSSAYSANVWSNVNAYPISQTVSTVLTQFTANVGDIIRQPSTGANATVINSHSSFNSNIESPFVLAVRFNSGRFTIGSGNLTINGTSVPAYPAAVSCVTDIGLAYNTTNTFKLNSTVSTAAVYVNGANTYAFPTNITSVGVTTGAQTAQGLGFDEGRFDQGSLTIPSSLTIDINSGWITGYLPPQTANSTEYNFSVEVYKRDYSNYVTTQLYTLTILGSLNNTITWLTPSDLGTIENGAISDLSLVALSSVGKTLYYSYTPGAYIRLPQGLELRPDGLISGRVSFELFSLDNGYTTFDNNNYAVGITTGITTFDHTYTFSVTAADLAQTTSATQTFTILVLENNIKPYENLYLTALMNHYQRREYQNIVLNQNVFPHNMIYRSTDPWFGVSNQITTLFLAGLNPSTFAEYATAVNTNHYGKRLLFGDVKTAVARENNVYDVILLSTGETIGTMNKNTGYFTPTISAFNAGYVPGTVIPDGSALGQEHIKYEVVYVEILDENTPPSPEKNQDSIDLTGVIANPYYDAAGNAYITATPNSFTNMDDAIINTIGYANKGALPNWMTSVQLNGTQLGFTRAAVLAYTNPGTSAAIAWRFQQQGYDLNDLNFTIDRYLLDNSYTANFDITANAFIPSRETTFDRYPPLNGAYTNVGTVDYAVSIPFESINEKSLLQINDTIDSYGNPGLDGITSFSDGQTLIFYKQEFPTGTDIGNQYNQGWANSLAPWDSSDIADSGEWDYNSTEGWDPAIYVPGYSEWINNRISGNVTYYPVVNQRIGVWTLSINADNYVKLIPTLLPSATAATIVGNVLTVAGAVTAKFTSGMIIYGNATVGGTSYIPANTYIVAQRTSTLSGNVQGGAGTYILNHSLTGANSAALGTTTIYQDMAYNDSLFVRRGFTHGGVHVYNDPSIKPGTLVPSWSAIPQQIKTTSTEFDGTGTQFHDYRDIYEVPAEGDSVITFPHTNVFN